MWGGPDLRSQRTPFEPQLGVKRVCPPASWPTSPSGPPVTPAQFVAIIGGNALPQGPRAKNSPGSHVWWIRNTAQDPPSRRGQRMRPQNATKPEQRSLTGLTECPPHTEPRLSTFSLCLLPFSPPVAQHFTECPCGAGHRINRPLRGTSADQQPLQKEARAALPGEVPGEQAARAAAPAHGGGPSGHKRMMTGPTSCQMASLSPASQDTSLSRLNSLASGRDQRCTSASHPATVNFRTLQPLPQAGCDLPGRHLSKRKRLPGPAAQDAELGQS